jgi:hypothetical protein
VLKLAGDEWAEDMPLLCTEEFELLLELELEESVDVLFELFELLDPEPKTISCVAEKVLRLVRPFISTVRVKVPVFESL